MTNTRKIRSYVKRDGRITPAQEAAWLHHWEKYGLKSEDGILDRQSVFGRTVPCILEIGFGNGAILAAYASEKSDWDFIGVEVYRSGVGTLLAQLEKKQLSNVRIFSEDVIDVLTKAIPDQSLSRVLIFFPDPWPKKRHHKRRLIQVSFMTLLYTKLRPGGEVFIATDWEPYAEHVKEIMQHFPGFMLETEERPAFRPLTKFELRGIREQRKVHDFKFTRRGDSER